MIRKSIVAFLALIASYSFFISSTDIGWNVVQNQWHGNMVKADRFIYSDTNQDIVLLGTSMSSRLKLEGVYNLGLDGLSVGDGIEVVKKSEKLPKTLLIELNLLFKTLDKSFSESIVRSPLQGVIKEVLPVTRSHNQPAGVLGYPLVVGFNKIGYELNKRFPPSKREQSNSSLLNNVEPKTEDEEWKEEVHKNLKKLLNFKEDKTRVLFFEIPSGDKQCQSQKQEYIKKEIVKLFGKRSLLPEVNCDQYQYTDGVHMTLESAIDYSNQLIEFYEKTRR